MWSTRGSLEGMVSWTLIRMRAPLFAKFSHRRLRRSARFNKVFRICLGKTWYFYRNNWGVGVCWVTLPVFPSATRVSCIGSFEGKTDTGTMTVPMTMRARMKMVGMTTGARGKGRGESGSSLWAMPTLRAADVSDYRVGVAPERAGARSGWSLRVLAYLGGPRARGGPIARPSAGRSPRCARR
jgi:hypothetical protein